MKEFKDILLARQSCRNYSSKPVSKDDIMTCIASAGLAPSACNSQPWKFVVVTDDEKRMQFAKLLQIIGFNLWAENAPVLVAVCEEAEPKLMPAVLKRWDCKHYSQFDLGLAHGRGLSQKKTESGQQRAPRHANTTNTIPILIDLIIYFPFEKIHITVNHP